MLHALVDASCTAAHWSTLPRLPTATQQQMVSLQTLPLGQVLLTRTVSHAWNGDMAHCPQV